MKTLLQNARYSLRLLRKNPGFSAVAVITLALVIGANSAIFSVIYGVMLAPLPYQNPDQRVMVWSKIHGNNHVVSASDFLDWKRNSTIFQELVAWTGAAFNFATSASSAAISLSSFFTSSTSSICFFAPANCCLSCGSFLLITSSRFLALPSIEEILKFNDELFLDLTCNVIQPCQ